LTRWGSQVQSLLRPPRTDRQPSEAFSAFAKRGMPCPPDPPISPPQSDHFDGRRFRNPGTSSRSGGLLAVLKWQMRRDRVRWPDSIVDPRYNPPPEPNSPRDIVATYIGHSTFLLRLGGLTILTDPIFSLRCSPVSWAGPKRVRPPGLALADLPPIDLILLSHNHYDHMDLPSLRALRSRGDTVVVTTLGNGPRLRRLGFTRVEALDWWGSTQIGDARVTATPARHFAARTLWDRNRTLWSGFMIEAAERRLLFAGDSGAGGHWAEIGKRLGPPDLALLPIGAYEPRWMMAPVHMNPHEAVQAHQALGAQRSIGMHFGTFRLTDEAVDAPVQTLSVALRAAAIEPSQFSTLGFGQSMVAIKDDAD
jgi:L-ascorbate metabolism protein UlaG (beta-lactamase superfamily)